MFRGAVDDDVAEAVFACYSLPGCRLFILFIDPFVDLDRTNDAVCGLLDRLSNLRPAFHVARMLNTILFADGHDLAAVDPPAGGRDHILGLHGGGHQLWLLLPEGRQVDPASASELSLGEGIEIYALEEGLNRVVASHEELAAAICSVSGPCLIRSPI